MYPFKYLHEYLYPQFSGASLQNRIAQDLLRFKSEVYDQSPVHDNSGGMGLESAFTLHNIIRKLKPRTVVESGVWKGFTTYITNSIDSVEEIYCFDPVIRNKGFVKFISPKARYFDMDWASTVFSFINPQNSVVLFDDHQDQLERLLVAYARGYEFIVFDDNYFFGGGGHSGLADYMRKDAGVLGSVVKNIYIAPPLVEPSKGLQPVFGDAAEFQSEVIETVKRQDDYNWVTLVELQASCQWSRSQIPDRDYVLSAYSREP